MMKLYNNYGRDSNPYFGCLDVLYEAYDVTVSREINGDYTLEFSYPPFI